MRLVSACSHYQRVAVINKNLREIGGCFGRLTRAYVRKQADQSSLRWDGVLSKYKSLLTYVSNFERNINIMPVLNEMLSPISKTFDVKSESSDERNLAMGLVVTATNQLICLEKVLSQIVGTLLGGIKAAKAAGMTADEQRHVIRHQLSIDDSAIPQVVLTRISETYREVVSEENATVAENVVATAKATPKNSRPSKIDPEDMGKLVEFVMGLKSVASVGEAITTLRGTARNLALQEEAKK